MHKLRKKIDGISSVAEARSLDESATRVGARFSELVWLAEPLARSARAAIAEWALDLEQADRSRWAWWLLLSANDLGWSDARVQRELELIFSDERARQDLPVPTEIGRTEIGRVMRAASEMTGTPLHRAQLVADFAGGLLRSGSLPRQLTGAETLTELLKSGKVDSRLVLERLCLRIGAEEQHLLAIKLRIAAAIEPADRLNWIVDGSGALRRLAVDASGESAGDTASLTTAVFGMADSQSAEDRVAVARYLGRTPLACNAGVLRALAEDASSAVRAQALESLGIRKCRSSEARALVARGLRDSSGHVRLFAIQATGSVLAEAREVSVALRDAVTDPDEYCRCAALDVLLRWRILDSWSIAALVNELGAGSEDSARDLVGVLRQEASQLHGVMTSRLVELIPSADDRATAGIVVALDALGFRGRLELTTERVAVLERSSRGGAAFKRISR